MTISLDKKVEESKSGISDMDEVFRFKVGMGYDVEDVIEVEIPILLYNKVREWVGQETMARYEFGFHFQERVEHDFPELDRTIQLAIHDWGKTIDMKDIPKNLLKVYHLFSSWFEE